VRVFTQRLRSPAFRVAAKDGGARLATACVAEGLDFHSKLFHKHGSVQHASAVSVPARSGSDALGLRGAEGHSNDRVEITGRVLKQPSTLAIRIRGWTCE